MTVDSGFAHVIHHIVEISINHLVTTHTVEKLFINNHAKFQGINKFNDFIYLQDD